MLLTNGTPFVPFVFETEDVARQPFVVFVLRGTFRIVEGEPLALADEQDPTLLADVYRGEPGRSSLLWESDLAPFKPRSDVIVEAVAHAPGDEPASSWHVRVRVGRLDQTLRVTGPRAFRRSRRHWLLAEPEPCRAVPMTYEHAFGGSQAVDETVHVCRQNPVGMGWLSSLADLPRSVERISAAQIEAVDDPIRELGQSHRPRGWGALARAWQPRLALAGTFDESWRLERWPALPLDFDFAHYNSAPPDMTYPGYLRGDEPVALEGLGPEGRRTFRLPGLGARARFQWASGREIAVPCALDTLRIDATADRAHLTWRAWAKATPEIRRIAADLGAARETISRSEETHG